MDLDALGVAPLARALTPPPRNVAIVNELALAAGRGKESTTLVATPLIKST